MAAGDATTGHAASDATTASGYAACDTASDAAYSLAVTIGQSVARADSYAYGPGCTGNCNAHAGAASAIGWHRWRNDTASG